MPARVIVYCKRPVRGVSSRDLTNELAMADLYTLAEALNLPEGEVAAVNAMRPHLRVNEDLMVHWKQDS